MTERGQLLSAETFSGLDEDEKNRIRKELCRDEEFHKQFEVINVDQIAVEASIVDDLHVEELRHSMGKKCGQTTPITVGARCEKGKIVFHITDGFHRTAVKRTLEEPTIDAVVLYGLTMEEIYDLRVLAASSVKAVKFARLASWMQQSFSSSKWGDKGIKLSQALGLAMNWGISDSPGQRLGLSVEEAEELKDFLKDKETAWQGKLSSFYHDINAVEHSFPEIVEEVRTGGGGHGRGQGMLNPSRFKMMVKFLPDNLEGQRKMVNLIREYDLTTDKVELVAQVLALLLSGEAGSNFSVEETLAAMEMDPENIASEILLSLGKIEKNKEDKSGKEDGNNCDKRYPRTRRLGENTYDSVLSREELEEENELLRQALSEQEAKSEFGGNGNLPHWYKNSNLSWKERKVLHGLIEEGRSLEAIAVELGLTSNRVSQLMVSGTRKARLLFQQRIIEVKAKAVQEEFGGGGRW